eukprot:jgi/Chrpa1/13956/Chrysochromulina_OHIO_Genome00020621-RA
MLAKLLICLFACSASALNLGVSRRAVAKVAAASGLAAIAAPAFAERGLMTAALEAPWMGQAASNAVLGASKPLKPGYEPVSVTVAIGRPGAETAEYGAALPKSAKYDTNTYANSNKNIGGDLAVPKAAMERLLSR